MLDNDAIHETSSSPVLGLKHALGLTALAGLAFLGIHEAGVALRGAAGVAHQGRVLKALITLQKDAGSDTGALETQGMRLVRDDRRLCLAVSPLFNGALDHGSILDHERHRMPVPRLGRHLHDRQDLQFMRIGRETLDGFKATHNLSHAQKDRIDLEIDRNTRQQNWMKSHYRY